ncbi:MAG: hypothetical protein UR22_C0019G0025 [Parcubacteria group bacterium GW2011_GWC2_32_10]|nr:MAG: hypothetical protein UR22_C0019G0025 [Parcubacteria group bacterium GW2011_GWC2_32_10]
MLAKISEFVKVHRANIILFIVIILLVLFSFAFGFITAKYQEKPKIQINTNL